MAAQTRAEVQKDAIRMKRILSMLTSNWGLKLLALILAIAVYCSMRDSIRKERGAAPRLIEMGGGRAP